MLKRSAMFAALTALSAVNGYAAAASVEEERGFPLTIVFALIAVFCSLGVVLLAAAKKKRISG